MLVPNVPTDYAALITAVAAGDVDACQLIARKSGLPPFNGALLAMLARIAAALEKSNA